MTINVAACIAGMDALALRMEIATLEIVHEAANHVQAQSRIEAPEGTPGNTTNAPGDLKASILIEGPTGGGGTYTALVGPTVIYGRQRELGGTITTKSAPWLVFTKYGHVYMKSSVYQEPNYYMYRGLFAALPEIEVSIEKLVTAAIVGG